MRFVVLLCGLMLCIACGGSSDTDPVGDDTSSSDSNDTLSSDSGDTSSSDSQDSASVDVPEDDTTVATDTGEPPVEACDPSGAWTFEISTAALPGEGCAPDGAPSQSPNTQEYVVQPGDDGAFVISMVEPQEPNPEMTVEVIGDGPSCTVLVTVTAEVYVPGAGEGDEGGTASIQYVYTVSEDQGAISGSGTVQSSFTKDSGEVQQDCTEDIAVAGTFVPAVP